MVVSLNSRLESNEDEEEEGYREVRGLVELVPHDVVMYDTCGKTETSL